MGYFGQTQKWNGISRSQWGFCGLDNNLCLSGIAGSRVFDYYSLHRAYMLETLFYVWRISHAKKVNVTVEWIWQPVFWQFIRLHFGTRASSCTACSPIWPSNAAFLTVWDNLHFTAASWTPSPEFLLTTSRFPALQGGVINHSGLEHGFWNLIWISEPGFESQACHSCSTHSWEHCQTSMFPSQ